jgi:hypothetical protein
MGCSAGAWWSAPWSTMPASKQPCMHALPACRSAKRAWRALATLFVQCVAPGLVARRHRGYRPRAPAAAAVPGHLRAGGQPRKPDQQLVRGARRAAAAAAARCEAAWQRRGALQPAVWAACFLRSCTDTTHARTHTHTHTHTYTYAQVPRLRAQHAGAQLHLPLQRRRDAAQQQARRWLERKVRAGARRAHGHQQRRGLWLRVRNGGRPGWVLSGGRVQGLVRAHAQGLHGGTAHASLAHTHTHTHTGACCAAACAHTRWQACAACAWAKS